MADTILTPSRVRPLPFAGLAKRLLTAVISYEVLAYGLASVQAMGLTLPTMVDENRPNPRAICQANLTRIVRVAEGWDKNHPDRTFPRPKLEDLARDLPGGLPTCPDGGHYEIVKAGRTLRIVDGPRAVVPEGRIAIRCTGDHDMGLIENPYEEMRRRAAAKSQP
ncbi:MAG: hypothetical protein ACO1SV_15090 [Fimbriimonas sp.]